MSGVKIHVPKRKFPYHALLVSTTTVEKFLPFPWKGDIVEATTEKDYVPGLYGFTSLEKRDKFVSMINASNEFKPCMKVDVQF